MNKLLTKIAGALLGISLAVGVGVAAGKKQSIAQVSALTGAHEDFVLSSKNSVTQGVVTVSYAANGGTAPAWYDAGLRLYAKNKVTISGTSNITGVEFNWEKQGSKTFASATASTGSYTHPSNTGVGTWTGDAASVVFTLGDSGQLQLNTFTVYYASSDIVVTITGSSTVEEGSPVTYSCNAGVTAVWTLENVSPAGCATISGSTVTAHQSGTAKLVCTPSTAGYLKNTLNLTISASIKHNAIAAGQYFIAAAADVAHSETGLLVPSEGSDPQSASTSFSNLENAWTIEENASADDAYNIKKGSLYLVAINDSQGISITSTAPGSSEYWKISKNGTDSYGNVQYRLTYTDEGSRYLALYSGGSPYKFRYYNSGDNLNMNLIPVSKTLTALNVSGTLTKASYNQNDTFDPSGASVKGTYSNGYGDNSFVYLDETNNVSWNPSVLSSAGSVNVYARIGELLSSNYFTVTVTAISVPTTGVEVSPTSHTFTYEQINSTCQLTATVSPNDASNKNVTWSSSNESVAIVSSTGLVTAKGVGTAAITVTTVNGGFTATSTITVNPFAGEYHKITDASKLYAGMKFALVYENGASSKVAGTIASGKVFFSSEDATVDGGEATSSSETVFTLGGTVNEWTLTTSQGLLFATGAKSLEFDSEAEGADSTWQITITDGNVFITSNTDGYGTIKYNTSSPRFLNYASGQASIQLYAADPDDNVYGFISNYMKMGDTSLAGDGNGACKDSGYYLNAKIALNDLTSGEKSAFQNNTGSKYTAALARYNKWAVANNDAAPFDGYDEVHTTLRSASVFATTETSNTVAIIVIVSITSVGAIAGYFFIRKRRVI